MNVLVATEGPQDLRTLAPHVQRLATATGGNYRAVRVLRPLLDLGSDRSPSVHQATERVAARWKAELAAELGGDDGLGHVDVPVLAHGQSVPGVILSSARDHHAGVIAVWSNNKGTLGQLLFGSTAATLLKDAHIPVMVVGPGVQNAVDVGPYRILVTTDGSTASRAAFDALSGLCAGQVVKATILQVLEPDSRMTLEEGRDQLRTWRSKLPDSFDVDVEILAVTPKGGVGDAIVARAHELGTDAIWMSTHGKSALRRFVAGSVATDVVTRSPIPVVLVKAFAD